MKKAPLVALMLLLLSPGILAQQRGAAPADEQKMLVTGVLYDVNGAVIIYGTSLVAESSGGKKYEVATDEEGVYRFELPLGVYKIKASANGFCPRQVTDFRVVNSTHGRMSLDFVLEVAGGQPGCKHEYTIETRPKSRRKRPGIILE